MIVYEKSGVVAEPHQLTRGMELVILAVPGNDLVLERLELEGSDTG